MLCRDTPRDRHSSGITWLVYLACLHSHVLRTYCNFESKIAISITLFGRRPNNKVCRYFSEIVTLFLFSFYYFAIALLGAVKLTIF